MYVYKKEKKFTWNFIWNYINIKRTETILPFPIKLLKLNLMMF